MEAKHTGKHTDNWPQHYTTILHSDYNGCYVHDVTKLTLITLVGPVPVPSASLTTVPNPHLCSEPALLPLLLVAPLCWCLLRSTAAADDDADVPVRIEEPPVLAPHLALSGPTRTCYDQSNSMKQQQQ